jgi:osmotically-inducible protein OsmY
MPTSSEVTKHIKAALERDPRVNLHRFPLRVVASDAVVTLEGEVDSLAAKKTALRIAHEVAGSSRIDDALRVVPADRRADGELAVAYTEALLEQREFQNCTLRRRYRGEVETVQEALDDMPVGEIEYGAVGGVITLEGQVISLSHQRMAEVLAWWTRGCCNVVNRLQIVPAEEDNDDELTDAIRLVLETDPQVHAEQIGIQSAAGRVTLSGAVTTDVERRMVEHDTWAVRGVSDVVNRVEVTP